jgi:hypothetical protein
MSMALIQFSEEVRDNYSPYHGKNNTGSILVLDDDCDTTALIQFHCRGMDTIFLDSRIHFSIEAF